MAAAMSGKRLLKELGKIRNDGLPPGVELVSSGEGEGNISDWTFDIRVLDDNPIYKDQIYRLRFRFPKAYPIGAIATSTTPAACLQATDFVKQNLQRSFSRTSKTDPSPFTPTCTPTASSVSIYSVRKDGARCKARKASA